MRGILVFGEMRVAGDNEEKQSIARLELRLRDLAANETQAAMIREARNAVPLLSLEDISAHVAVLQESLQWFYTLVDEQDHLELAAERVTHEIQTRLQGLLAKAENLAEKIPKASIQDATERALAVLLAVEALNTVIQTLGNALGEYRFDATQIFPILAKAQAIYADEAAVRGIDITIDMPFSLEAEISKPHFQHAVNNLVHNAVKYSFRTVPGGKRRWVRIGARAEKGDVVLTVSNYGVGILPEEIRSGSLFELNLRGKLTHGEFRPGSGRGLYFVRRVIEAHNGRIEVQSELIATDSAPEGKPHHNRFTVYIPLKRRRADRHV